MTVKHNDPGMTPTGLMDGLAEGLRPVLSRVLVNHMGAGDKGITVHDQTTPPPQMEGDEDLLFPYCLIELGDGRDSAEGVSTQDVLFLCGVFDEDQNYKGYRDVASMVWSIRFYLLTNPTIAGRFTLKYPLEWVLPKGTEDHPYYYGGVIAKYTIPRLAPLYPNT